MSSVLTFINLSIVHVIHPLFIFRDSYHMIMSKSTHIYSEYNNNSYCSQMRSYLCHCEFCPTEMYLEMNENVKIQLFLLQEQRLRYLQQGGRSNQGQTQVGSICLSSIDF